MRVMKASMMAVAIAAIAAAGLTAQDADRKVAGGGITAKGWQGIVDPPAAKKGTTINDSKFMEMGGGFHINAGSAATYWNPANTAKGDYSVSATFAEGKSSSDHPHSYGLVIGGNNMNSDKKSFVYCVAYGNGTALVRGFNGDTVFTPAKRTANPAINKAGADGSVTQQIAWTVKGDTVSCAVNGTVVHSFSKADLVGPGKLESTDGIYGIRVAHNVDVMVTNLTKK